MPNGFFPNSCRTFTPTLPGGTSMGDSTYSRLSAGFVLVGCALSRQMDGQFTLTALKAAVGCHWPPAMWYLHTFGGSRNSGVVYHPGLADSVP
jgi:hypothetical protein